MYEANVIIIIWDFLSCFAQNVMNLEYVPVVLKPACLISWLRFLFILTRECFLMQDLKVANN